MKNKFLLSITCILLILNFTSNAQTTLAFDKGDNVLGLGIGIGGHYGASGSGYTSQTPAIGLIYEKGMRWEAGPGIIGLGGYLGYKSLRYKAVNGFYSYDWKWTYTIIGIRGAYHYQFADNFDTYAGLLLSYNNASFSDHTVADNGYVYSYPGGSANAIGLSLFLGGRYYFSEQWGAFAELGYGITYLQLGAVYKF